MAALEVMRYPTTLLARLADHTYVRCCERSVDDIVAVRRSTERARLELERRLGAGVIRPLEFAKAFDDETLLFQEHLALRLSAEDYSILLGLEPDDRVPLADPRIVRQLSR